MPARPGVPFCPRVCAAPVTVGVTLLVPLSPSAGLKARPSLWLQPAMLNPARGTLGEAVEAALVLTSAFSPQLIQTISVVDRDEPQSGHRFYFTLAPEATNNHHFSLLDIQGKSCCTLGPASLRLSSTSGHGLQALCQLWVLWTCCRASCQPEMVGLIS